MQSLLKRESMRFTEKTLSRQIKQGGGSNHGIQISIKFIRIGLSG